MKVAAASAAALLAAIQAAPRPEVEAARRAAEERGWEVLRALRADLDGDGLFEAVAAIERGGALELTVWRYDQERDRAHLVYRGVALDGDVVLALRAEQMVEGPAPELVFEVREQTPDESVRRVSVATFRRGRLVPIFEGTFSLDDLRPAGSGVEVLAFGPTGAGYRIADLDGDGTAEIAVRRDVKTVSARRIDGGRLRAVVGAREVVFRYRPGDPAGRYVEREEQTTSYLREVTPSRVTASSQYLPPHLEDKYARKAIESGVDGIFSQAAESSGTPPERDAGAAREGDFDFTLRREPAPRADWASDGDLDTAWCEGAAGNGVGEYWEAHFAKAVPLRMARVVFGDVRNRRLYRAANRVDEVTLVFANGDRATFDRRRPRLSSGPLAAYEEVPLREGRPGRATFLFFARPVEAEWVRIEFTSVRKRSRANRSCISEVVFYAAREGTGE